MKIYPFNKSGAKGQRMFRLLDQRFNPGQVGVATASATGFSKTRTPSTLSCHMNSLSLNMPSNLAGIKRPIVNVQADVQTAWGDFGDGVNELDFSGGEELPLTYGCPIDDETMKRLIDAGLYRDENFEALLSKLTKDDVFDVEADMNVYSIVPPEDETENNGRLIAFAEPVDVIHPEHDPSTYTNIRDVLRKAADLAVQLRKDGVSMADLIDDAEYDTGRDQEVVITHTFKDVVAEYREREAKAAEVDNRIAESSELLDEEIDVTEHLKDRISIDKTDEDDRIRELKEMANQHEQEAAASYDPGDMEDEVVEDEPEDDDDEYDYEAPSDPFEDEDEDELER